MENIRKMANKAKRAINLIIDFVQKRPYLQALLVFSFFVFIFQWMYISVSPLISSDDHYFHFRFAQLMTERGFFPMFNDFKNIHFSPIASGEYYATYNFLFYLVIIPLTFIKPLYLAIKLYAVLAGALAFTMFYLYCSWYGVRRPFAMTVVVVSLIGASSLWHLFLSRPYVLAPLILIGLLFALMGKRYWSVFVLSFVYFFWHNVTFWFPLLIAVTYFVFEKFYIFKTNIKSILATIGGMMLAVITATIFAHGFITYQIKAVSGVLINTINSTTGFIPQGGELYPVDFFTYITSNPLLFAFFTVVVCFEVAEYLYYRKDITVAGYDHHIGVDPRQPLKMTVFFISILFFFGTIKISARFNDYFIFFVGLYIVLALSTLLENIQFLTKRAGRSVAVGLTVVILALFTNSILQIQSTIATSGSPVEVFEGVGGWLKNNTSNDELVFNQNWSWFPQLYYYSPNNNYVAGMEPREFYNFNQKLYWKWLNIGYLGYSCDQENCTEMENLRTTMLRATSTTAVWNKNMGDEIARVLLTEFKSSYIIGSPSETTRLNAVLENNKHFKKVYGEGKAYFIYKVSP